MKRACLLATLALAGCRVVGPDTRVAPAPAPAAFKSERTDASSPASVWSETWWTVFGDAQLNALEQQALAANPSLDAALARVDEARARLGILRADTRPGASLSGSARLAGESAERTLPVPGRPVRYRDSGDTYRVAFDASYEVDLWGRVKRSLEGAEAGLRAAEADRRGVRLALTADVAQTYLGLRAVEAEDAVLRRTLEQRESVLGLLRARFAAGFSTEVDIRRSEAELAALKAERADLARRRALYENALAVLCGRAPSDFADLADLPLPALPSIRAGLPAEVVARRPDVAFSEAQLSARLADIGVAQAARYPSIRLTGSAGFESADLGSLLDRPSQFWQIGPSLSLPLFTGGRTEKTIAAAVARAEQSRADHRLRTLQALREVEDALVDLRQQAAQADALHEAIEAAEAASQLARTRHEGGFTPYLEVLDTERSQLAYERTRAQLQGARLQATVRLIRALGGGWQ